MCYTLARLSFKIIFLVTIFAVIVITILIIIIIILEIIIIITAVIVIIMTICIIALLDLANVLEKPSSGSRSVQNGPKARQGFDPLTNSSFMAKTF